VNAVDRAKEFISLSVIDRGCVLADESIITDLLDEINRIKQEIAEDCARIAEKMYENAGGNIAYSIRAKYLDGK